MRPSQLDQRDGLGGQPERLPQLRQVLHRPERLEAEREVGAHRGVLRVDRRPPGRRATNASAGTSEKSRSNGSTTSTSIPQAAISSACRSTVVISRGSLPGRQDLARVPVERDRDAAHAARARLLPHPGEDRLVPAVDPVEEPDGDDARRVVQRQRGEPVQDVHGEGGYRTGPTHRGARITSGRGLGAVVPVDADQAAVGVIHAVGPLDRGGREDPPVSGGDRLLVLEVEPGQVRDGALQRQRLAGLVRRGRRRDRERTDRGAPQRREVRAAAEGGADVGGEHPHVGPAAHRAGERDVGARRARS